MWQKHDLHNILETCLWKLTSLSKTTPKLRTLSDGHRVTWGKKPPWGKKPLLDIHKSKLDRKAYTTIV